MIFKSMSQSATLAGRLEALDKEIAVATAALGDLRTKRRDAIRDGDDAAAGKIEDAIGAAERKAQLQSERREILAAEHEAALAKDAIEEFARRHTERKDLNIK